MISLFQTSTTCWDTMIRDYGVVGTVSASASVTLVLILAIVMHKAFLSNCCGGTGTGSDSAYKRKGSSSSADKKRRRRKGHHHTKGGRGGGRIKGATTNVAGGSTAGPRLPIVEEISSDGACGGATASEGSSGLSAPDTDFMVHELGIHHEKEQPSRPRVDSQVSAVSSFVSHEEEGASITTSPSALESVVSSEETNDRASTVPSVFTVDTTLPDDISCGSISVRSGLTALQPNNRSSNSTTTNNDTSTISHSSNPRVAAKTNKLNRGQKPSPKTNAVVNQPPRSVTRTTHDPQTTATTPDNQSEGGFNNRANTKPKNPRGGKGRMSNSHTNPRAGRGKSGRPQKSSPKNQKPAARTESPVPRTTNTADMSVSPRINSNVLSTPASSKQMQSNNNNLIGIPPASPYTQSLFSCEVGASGWSLPALPVARDAPSATNTMYPAMSYQTNTFVAPYSRMDGELANSNDNSNFSFLPAPTGGSAGFWMSSNEVSPRSPSASSSNTNFATPQRAVRAPPGLSAPPGFSGPSVVAPVHNNVHNSPAPSDLYTPIRTSISTANNTVPSLVPVTPSFGSPNLTSPQVSPFSWSNGGGVLGCASSESPIVSPANSRRCHVVKENPFAADTDYDADYYPADDADCRIEAELQELGGRMVGSVLDF